jgi:hypothetical protein
MSNTTPTPSQPTPLPTTPGIPLQQYLNQRYDDYIENIGTRKHGMYDPLPKERKPLNEYLKERHDFYVESIGVIKDGLDNFERQDL